jgi:hypothetical protein
MSVKTRLGNVVLVDNQNRKKSANSQYYAVMLKNINNVYHPYLFTEIEMVVALERAKKNVEDQVEQSLLSKILD